MGTNYYHKRDVCDKCGRGEPADHIGKSSAGWRFLFHSEEGLPRSWSEWKERLEEGVIEDEYGDTVTLEDFEKMVEAKAGGRVELYGEERGLAWRDEEGHPFHKGEFS